MLNLSKRFVHDGNGNFGIMAAVSAMPLVLGIGLALDYSTLTRRHAEFQHAIDAAVLAVAHEGKDVSDSRAKEIARAFLGDNFDLRVTDLVVTHRNTTFALDAKTEVELAFGGLWGHSTWPLSASASADIAYASYEIALVLDTTGSMAGGKLVAMKEAVTGLIDSMSEQVRDEEKLKFALVPFATFVNVGEGFGPSFHAGKQVAGTGAPWLDLTGRSDFPQSELGTGASRFQLYKNLKLRWPGCVETRYAAGRDLDISDTPPDPGDPSTLFVPTFAIDEPDTGGYSNSYINSDAQLGDTSIPAKRKRWKKYGSESDARGLPLNGGQLVDPSQPVDPVTGDRYVPVDVRFSEMTALRKGPGKGCDMQPIAPLSNDYKKLKRLVRDFEAKGTTNITEGVAWGNRVLSPGAPFTEGKNKATTQIEKIMVVLTDGTNVFGNNSTAAGSSYASNGYLMDGRLGITSGTVRDTTQRMNERTLAACSAAKLAGTEVYTIRLEEPNVQTGAMLKECASSPDHYFDVPSRSQLDKAFEKIRERIVRVRISS